MGCCGCCPRFFPRFSGHANLCRSAGAPWTSSAGIFWPAYHLHRIFHVRPGCGEDGASAYILGAALRNTGLRASLHVGDGRTERTRCAPFHIEFHPDTCLRGWCVVLGFAYSQEALTAKISLSRRNLSWDSPAIDAIPPNGGLNQLPRLRSIRCSSTPSFRRKPESGFFNLSGRRTGPQLSPG